MIARHKILNEHELLVVGTQLRSNSGEIPWFQTILTGLTGIIVSAIWFLGIAPDDKSPNTLMVKPATDLLSSFIQPAPDILSLSAQVGFRVSVPNLKGLGADVKTYGESDFGGQAAAVMECQYHYATYLLYSFNRKTSLIDQMREVSGGRNEFYVTSGGDVSVVVWRDNASCYHALAAKTTEQDLLAFAENVATVT